MHAMMQSVRIVVCQHEHTAAFMVHGIGRRLLAILRKLDPGIPGGMGFSPVISLASNEIVRLRPEFLEGPSRAAANENVLSGLASVGISECCNLLDILV